MPAWGQRQSSADVSHTCARGVDGALGGYRLGVPIAPGRTLPREIALMKRSVGVVVAGGDMRHVPCPALRARGPAVTQVSDQPEALAEVRAAASADGRVTHRQLDGCLHAVAAPSMLQL